MKTLDRAMRDCQLKGLILNRMQPNGIIMFYACKGQGFSLLMLHGSPEFWMDLRPIPNTLASAFEVIVPDLRGCGDAGTAMTGPDGDAGATKVSSMRLGWSNCHGPLISSAHPETHVTLTSRKSLITAPIRDDRCHAEFLCAVSFNVRAS